MSTSASSLRVWIQKNAVLSTLCLAAISLVVTFMVSTSAPSFADTSNKDQGKTVVVTGFEPFGGREHNTSWQVAQKVAKALKADGTNEVVQEIPTQWSTFERNLRELVTDNHPDAIISIGEKSADGFTQPVLELVAHNYRSGTDIKGVSGGGTTDPVITGGDYLMNASTENEKALTKTVESGDSKLNTSRDAGGFLCNTALYVGIDMQQHGLVKHAAFFHVPAINDGDSQVDQFEDSQVDQFAAAITAYTKNLVGLSATPGASSSSIPTTTTSASPTTTSTASSKPGESASTTASKDTTRTAASGENSKPASDEKPASNERTNEVAGNHNNQRNAGTKSTNLDNASQTLSTGAENTAAEKNQKQPQNTHADPTKANVNSKAQSTLTNTQKNNALQQSPAAKANSSPLAKTGASGYGLGVAVLVLALGGLAAIRASKRSKTNL